MHGMHKTAGSSPARSTRIYFKLRISMQKRVFIIHGWEGSPQGDWFPWLKKELETKSFVVEVPIMPDTMHPTLEGWLGHLKKITGEPNENTYFIGHSLGVITILRYL